jgi:hypothetical protein
MRRVRATTLAPTPTGVSPSKNWSRERSRNPVPPADVMLALHNASLQPIMDCHTLTLG